MTVTISATRILQYLAVAAQVLLAVNPTQLPLRWQMPFMSVVAILQAIQAQVAHTHTPEGEKIPPGV